MTPAEKIEHVVFVMLENRSFDSLLGLLPHENPQFRRPPQGWGNPEDPSDGAPVIPLAPTSQDVRGHGPGHHHANALRQLTGPHTDGKWEALGRRPWESLKDQWDQLLAAGASNRGFYWDYKRHEHAAEPARVMQMWRQRFVPALWQLAQEYGICQRWHASLPGMTQPNRLFSLCGTSFGWVDHARNITKVRRAPRGWSAFARLKKQGISHAFFGDATSLTPLICPDARKCNSPRRRFYELAREGDLPEVSVVEPFNLPNGHSQHPGMNEGPETISRGDAFIARVYNALRSNAGAWRRTLLIITWDEHGGFPDHEPPPRNDSWATVPPGLARSQGFDFTLLGVRVPAIVASPWIAKGTLNDEIRDHTSFLSTLREVFPHFGAPLSVRDAVMPGVGSLLSDDCDASPSRLPAAEAHEDAGSLSSLDAFAGSSPDEPIDAYGRHLVGAMIGVAREKGVDVGVEDLRPDFTVQEALDVCRKVAPLVGGTDEITPL